MILKLLYSTLTISLAIFAGFYLSLSDTISKFQSNFLIASYFIVVIFIFFMFLISFKKLPSKTISLLNLIFTPFIFLTLQFYFYQNLTLYDYLTMVAMVLISGVIIAFTIIITLGPIFTKRKETIKEVLFYIPTAFAQIIFILPGLGAIYIFSNHLIGQYSIWILFILILAIIQNSYSLCYQLKQKHILD